MKIIEQARAPNPRRVRIFLAEKGIPMTYEQVSLADMEHKTESFRSLNPFLSVPVLVLDDGTAVSESMAICRYFEEVQPEPRLMGETPLEKATIEMWARRMELELFYRVAQCFRHLHPAMAELEKPQIADWGNANRPRILSTPENTRRPSRGTRVHYGLGLYRGRHYRPGGHRLHEAGARRTPSRDGKSRTLVRSRLFPSKCFSIDVPVPCVTHTSPCSQLKRSGWEQHGQGQLRGQYAEDDSRGFRRCIRSRRTAANVLSRRARREDVSDRLRGDRDDRDAQIWVGPGWRGHRGVVPPSTAITIQGSSGGSSTPTTSRAASTP